MRCAICGGLKEGSVFVRTSDFYCIGHNDVHPRENRVSYIVAEEREERCQVCHGVIKNKTTGGGDWFVVCSTGGRCKPEDWKLNSLGIPVLNLSDNPLNPENIEVGERVEVDHYVDYPPLKGIVSEINAKGLIIVKLDVGGYKETFNSFIGRIENG